MLGQIGRLLCGVVFLSASATAAGAQLFNFNWTDVLGFGTQMELVEPGATVNASVGGFATFKEGIWREAEAKGISRRTFDLAFAGLTPDPSVLEKASHQAEFVTPVWEYVTNAVSGRRLEDGQRALARYQGVLDAIEATYGVSRYVVVAIWGVESSYGQVLDDPTVVKPVIRSLATLAALDRRRARFGRTQLLAALSILERGDTTPELMVGSWAGAMGHTQFIPTTYLARAVDFDHDGRRDIWQSVPDALASTANYLAASRWRPGETWGYEVILPPGFDYSLAGQANPIAAWQRLGIARTRGRVFPRPNDQARLLAPAGAHGPAFLTLANFDVIKRYNSSDAYALAVGYLADRLAGGHEFAADWPRDDRLLVEAEREELQRLLDSRGFDPGGIDGKLGPMTERAVRAYQASVGLTPDGFATKSLLDRLRNNT